MRHLPSDHTNRRTVRTTRVRIIRLRNDYKALMSRIETGLHEHFATSKEPNTATGDSTQAKSSNTVPIRQDRGSAAASEDRAGAAFAKVNSVMAGSPADQAGLKAGDEVISFGDVNWLNHEKLARVARTVQRREGVCGEGFRYCKIMLIFA